MNEQLARVSNRIAEVVQNYCAGIKATRGDAEFTANELRTFVAWHAESAPGSADRILRDLRKKGVVKYTVVDRRRSLYRVDFVA